MAALRIFSQKLLNNKLKSPICNKISAIFIAQSRSKSIFRYDDSRDPAPVFFNKDIQQHLYKLTRVDLNKVYRKRKIGTKYLSQPVYKFMTTEQLQEAYKEAEQAVQDLIQMPPVIKPRKPIDSVLSHDPGLQGLHTSNLVFTDITFGVSNNDRIIVVRESDGTLRKANWSLRDRMNQVYFPTVGREIRTPRMFEDNHLASLLNRREYEFVLDRACLQFEPADPEYHRITEQSYLHVNENDGFELLRSTRHFGPLAFYLAWFKLADNLLLELLETARIEEAAHLVSLYASVHACRIDGDMDMLVENYIKEYATKRASLELALQAYRELERERRELDAGIKIAHGQH